MNNSIPNKKLSTTENPSLPAATSDASTIQQQRMTHTAKSELLRDKTIELEELTRINDLSAHLGQHFDRLANDIHWLAEGNQRIADVLSHWDFVFETMGLMNTKSGVDARNPTMVRLPIVSKSRSTED